MKEEGRREEGVARSLLARGVLPGEATSFTPGDGVAAEPGGPFMTLVDCSSWRPRKFLTLHQTKNDSFLPVNILLSLLEPSPKRC